MVIFATPAQGIPAALAWEERADKKPSTINAYSHILKSRLPPVFGSRAMGGITGSDLRKYQVEQGCFTFTR